MIAFVLRRALILVPMLAGIALLVFLLMYLAPGDFLSAARTDREVSREFIEVINPGTCSSDSGCATWCRSTGP